MARPPRVLVTRPMDQADALAQRLVAIGVEPVVVPTVAILPPASFDALDRALRSLAAYDWVVFTSRNGVQAFCDRRRALGISGVWPSRLRWAAIGPGTAAVLEAHEIADVWMPSRYLGEALAEELPATPGGRLLRVRGETASDLPSQRLRERGVDVDDVLAYRTEEAPAGTSGLLAEAWAAGVDAVVFTSASTVRGFARAAAEAGLLQGVRNVMLIAIGPVTAEAITAAGWRADLTAAEHSLDGLVQVLAGRGEGRATGFRRR